ncbi:far upstream element-binding protein 1-like [Cucurbita maxima]|uniref:Far upstream element-binding protein 1-like n=1 Tax=Cucurbita maxima TaxID=3661 RepID=A0A6J1JME2_CUCMA|nr:far upstream element-binding protein 1-like [Cucurbita maxima]
MKDHQDTQELHPDTNKRKLEQNIQLAKQKAQEIVAKLVSNAESKRPRFDYEPASAAPASQNPLSSASPFPVSSGTQTGPYHGFQSTSKKINIPNIKVGLIIGKGGETIKYLQLQSGAKIQITRDFEADPQSLTRDVELMGTSEQVSRAEQLINEVMAEADSGASPATTNQGMTSSQPGVEQFVMKIPNNKVALVIGKGGETIKSIQSKSAARVQVIPLHLPPGDTSTERNVYINGLKEQIESAKELINEVMSGKRLVNTSETTSYAQSTYPPPTNWSQAGQQPPLQQQQQPQYGYAPGTYPPPPGPPYYSNYPTQVGSWDHANQASLQPSEQSTGYNYYGQQSQVGSAPPYPGYGYGQPGSAATHGYDQTYSQQVSSYGQNYSDQISPYDQQNMYLNSGGAPPGVLSTNGTDTEGTYPTAAYQVSDSQPVVNSMNGYWTYPSDLTQSLPQTGNDQSGYYQTVSGGQEQPPVAFQPVYAQSGYPPPPGVYSQEVTLSAPAMTPTQPQPPALPQTEAQTQPQPQPPATPQTEAQTQSQPPALPPTEAQTQPQPPAPLQSEAQTQPEPPSHELS